ncbi:hypothetical protein NRB16_21245 [Pseudomonas sp. LJDD11]|uniref:hypothetical protein n=1 Tax=unclassified Pseudomonas TaxID=196821 RepID=UPI0020974007|nr:MULTISPECIES: hypothetical protein [unclassified Pseudomonas]MCO8164669.1 hypothetical protein [Pseudomonas sp. 21LCFQ010]MCQ9426048.1 hypothetical protein [Pseudomonas sp. LJDD11]
MRTLIVATFALSLSLPILGATPPSAKQITAWAPAEVQQMGVQVENVVPVALPNNEQAYLASVSYENAGRNFQAGYLLVRPTLKQARALEDFGGQYNKIRLLDDYGSSQSVLIIGGAGSGQGSSAGSYSLVAFEGWEPRTLYSAGEQDNTGNCGPEVQRECWGNRVFLNVFSVGGPGGRIGLVVTNVKYTSVDMESPHQYTQESQLVFVDHPAY